MISAEDVRKSMRISHERLDMEIQKIIVTCLSDLKRVGVDIRKDDVLLDKACELYCKAQFDYQGRAGEYQKNYEMLRDGMSLSGGYRDVRPAD